MGKKFSFWLFEENLPQTYTFKESERSRELPLRVEMIHRFS